MILRDLCKVPWASIFRPCAGVQWDHWDNWYAHISFFDSEYVRYESWVCLYSGRSNKTVADLGKETCPISSVLLPCFELMWILYSKTNLSANGNICHGLDPSAHLWTSLLLVHQQKVVRQRLSSAGVIGQTGFQGITGEHRHRTSAGLEWILLQMVSCGLMDVCLCRVPQGWREAPASRAPQVSFTPACTNHLKVSKPPSGPQMTKSRLTAATSAGATKLTGITGPPGHHR